MDILTIGHSTLDIYMKLQSSDTTTSLSQEGSQICFYHGSKIPVEKIDINPGGNALHVAIATAKLGLKSKIYSELGDDEYTLKTIKLLKENKVDTTLCIKNKGKKNNISTVLVQGGERTIFSYHEKLEYRLRDWGNPKMIYFTSVPEGFEGFQLELLNYLKQNPKTILAFNPGSTHFKKGLPSFKNILEATDILFVNKEEAINITKEGQLLNIHKKLQTLGPKLTVITDGEKGASASAKGEIVGVTAYKTGLPVMDKTGAGDAFASGFLSAIHYHKNLEESLIWGAINSGHVVNQIGAVSGLLDKKTMENIVKENKKPEIAK